MNDLSHPLKWVVTLHEITRFGKRAIKVFFRVMEIPQIYIQYFPRIFFPISPKHFPMNFHKCTSIKLYLHFLLYQKLNGVCSI